MNRWLFTVLGTLAGIALCSGCRKSASDGSDEKVTTLGTTEVTAELTEIPGEFPPNNLYDYAYVLKYRVLKTHRGTVNGATILVAQYNPLKPRAEAADAKAEGIGGNLKSFRAGEVHRMALATPLDDYCMAGVINKYSAHKSAGAVQAMPPSAAATQPAAPEQPAVRGEAQTIYWALWTNRVGR